MPLFGRRAEDDVPSTADKFPHRFQVEDKRAPGYYLNNGTDWPDEICSRVSTDKVLAHLALIPEVYKWAMDDLGEEDDSELRLP